LYNKIDSEFIKLLDAAGLAEKKEDSRRRKYTPHSFRRFTKTLLSDNVGKEYSEWFLGHSKSEYYVHTTKDKEQKYLDVVKYLTFLDYSVIESTGKGIQNQLSEKEQEIQTLKDRISKLEQSNTVNFIDALHEKLKSKGYTGGPEKLIDKLAESHFFD
jgi:hypothetical protein